MKKSLLLLCAICALPAFADLKAPAIKTVTDGELVAAPHKTINKRGLAPKNGAMIFDGKGGIQVVRAIPSNDLTVVADVTVDQLPKEPFAVIAARSGFHSMLAITNKGEYTLSLWGADKKTSKRIAAKTKVVLGKKVRIAAVFTDQGNATRMQLFIDGKLEASLNFPVKSFPYNKDLFLGYLGYKKNGEATMPLVGKISNFWYAARPMTIQEISALN